MLSTKAIRMHSLLAPWHESRIMEQLPDQLYIHINIRYSHIGNYYCLVHLGALEAPAEHDFPHSRKKCTAMTLPGFAFHVDAAQNCGSCGASAKDSEGGRSDERPWQRFWACHREGLWERHEIGKSMLTSRSPKWAREFSLIRLDSRLFRCTHSRPSSAFLGGQETQSLSQSQPSWEPGSALVQFVETLMAGRMGPSHFPASPFVPSPLWFFKATLIPPFSSQVAAPLAASFTCFLAATNLLTCHQSRFQRTFCPPVQWRLCCFSGIGCSKGTLDVLVPSECSS